MESKVDLVSTTRFYVYVDVVFQVAPYTWKVMWNFYNRDLHVKVVLNMFNDLHLMYMEKLCGFFQNQDLRVRVQF